MDFECKKECFDELRARGFIHRRSVGSKFETTCLFHFLLNKISKKYFDENIVLGVDFVARFKFC